MKKSYSTPELEVHGAVESLTAYFGGTTQADQVFNAAGDVVQVGIGSVDADPCGAGEIGEGDACPS